MKNFSFELLINDRDIFNKKDTLVKTNLGLLKMELMVEYTLEIINIV